MKYTACSCLLKAYSWAVRVAQWFSACLQPRGDPGDLGSSLMSGSLHGACFSLCLCLSLSLSLSLLCFNWGSYRIHALHLIDSFKSLLIYRFLLPLIYLFNNFLSVDLLKKLVYPITFSIVCILLIGMV